MTDKQKRILAVALVVHVILLKLTWLRPPQAARRRSPGQEAVLAARVQPQHDGLGGLLAVRAPAPARRWWPRRA